MQSITLFSSSFPTTPPKGIPQNRQRTPQEGQSLRSCGESTRAPNRVGFRVLSPMGKARLPLHTGADFSHHKQCVRQVFYLLSAFRVLPGSGSYTVNLVMLFLSVRQPAVERSSRMIDWSLTKRVCIQRSSLSSRARRSAKRGIIPVLDWTPRVVWISPPSAFQLAATRQTSVYLRWRHRMEEKQILRTF